MVDFRCQRESSLLWCDEGRLDYVHELGPSVEVQSFGRRNTHCSTWGLQHNYGGASELSCDVAMLVACVELDPETREGLLVRERHIADAGVVFLLLLATSVRRSAITTKVPLLHAVEATPTCPED